MASRENSPPRGGQPKRRGSGYPGDVQSWVVVANAPWRWEPWSVEVVRRAAGVVAADGGANHLARIGVRPDAVVGDLDSLRPSVRAWIGEERLVPYPDQEHTDLHKALLYLVGGRRVRRAVVLAATGGRQDHALEALGVIARWAARASLEVREPGCRIVPLRRRRVFRTRAGQLVSLLPWGRCEGVRTVGLRWGLADETLDLHSRTGVSNRALGGRVEVSVRSGTLLVFLHDPPGADQGALAR